MESNSEKQGSSTAPSGSKGSVIAGDVISSVAIGPGTTTTYFVNQLAEADPSDVQQIAAAEIRLLITFYDVALKQARASFRWALVAAGIGLAFFMGAVIFLLTARTATIAMASVIGGAVVEVIAGINFFLYGKTTTQLADYHQRLDQTQRFLLANSICEALNGELKDKTRASLVQTIATPAMLPSNEEAQSS